MDTIVTDGFDEPIDTYEGYRVAYRSVMAQISGALRSAGSLGGRK